jgi:hypothetical protein
MANLKNLKPAWKKGESGNPKGGKKKPPTMKEMVEILPELPVILAKVLSEKKGDMTLIEAGIRRTALSWINSGNLNAGRLLLEYAYGRPGEMTAPKDNEQYQPPQITVNISKEAIDKLNGK